MNEREIRGRPWQMQLLRRKSSHVKLNSILTQTSLSIQMASTVIFKQTLTDNCLLDTDTWPLESSQIPQVLNQMNPLSLLLPLNLLLLLSSLPLLVPISQAQSCPVFFVISQPQPIGHRVLLIWPAPHLLVSVPWSSSPLLLLGSAQPPLT